MKAAAAGTESRGKQGFGRSLVVQYIALMTLIAVVLVTVFGLWSYHEQRQQMESQMLAEARVLEQSVQATWDFIDYEQENINTDADGSYNFKGLYCSLVGKSVGKLFTLSTDSRYVLRYTRLEPRNALDDRTPSSEPPLRNSGTAALRSTTDSPKMKAATRSFAT